MTIRLNTTTLAHAARGYLTIARAALTRGDLALARQALADWRRTWGEVKARIAAGEAHAVHAYSRNVFGGWHPVTVIDGTFRILHSHLYAHRQSAQRAALRYNVRTLGTPVA